jgi:hypothetical protein
MGADLHHLIVECFSHLPLISLEQPIKIARKKVKNKPTWSRCEIEKIKSGLSSLTQWFMIAFILVYAWYFSLGIYYRISVDDNGEIQLTSLRKITEVHARQIETIEDLRLGSPIGFIMFRLEREKDYLFFVVTDSDLQQVQKIIRRANPDMKLKSL